MDMLPSSNFRQKASKTTNPLSRYLNIVQSGIIEPVTRNTLQRNNGNGTFSDVACLAGIFQTDWAWSCLLADLDNDGWKDLHITNGYKKDVNDRDFHDFTTPDFTKNKKISALSGEEKIALTNMAPSYKSRNFIYQNKGDWTFEDQGGKWATMSPSWSCGAAWADFDKDGDLDLVVNNLEEPAFVYKNLCREQGKGNFFQLKLVGNATNPLAVGASVLIEYGGQKQYQELYPNRGIFSTVEHLVHFGIGAASTVEKVSVRWPDGSLQILTQVTANQRLELKYQTGLPKVKHLSEVPSQGLIFEEVTAGSGVNFRHIENPFTDFEQWPLNLWSLTDLGPLAVVGDANGDGLEDVFIGNSFDQPGAIFAQQKTGKFVRISQAVFEKYKNYEDHGGLFFDADADGDQDLFLCSGGMDASSELAWQFRLFINDGKGNFDNETVERLPVTKDIGLRAAAHDYDGDGDLDLFIGGRVQPKQWPLTPRSVVLQNNQGKFTDVTAQVGGDFERCGMVTDLQWLDLDGNGKKELVVVGEWMPVGIFVLEGGKLREKGQSLGFEGSNGLWNRLCAADLDKDGDMDLVTGNLGLNTRYKASQSAPFLCYAKDFDNNGTLDPVAAVYEGNICYPLLQKDVFQKQMPSLKKRFLKNHDFARATVDDLFPKADLAASLQLRAYTVQSCWWENRAGKFVRHELPIQAQVSVVQGIVAQDFNKDGHLDLLLAGNRYGFEVETNRADAGTGALFLGDGKGGFRWLDNRMSGFWAMEEARDLALLRAANGEALIVVPNNNRNAQVFRCK
jgi:enediyne biosynthesis protein E4